MKKIIDSELDLKSILRAEFARRSKVNSSYSLRAYAKYLNVDQSLLSKIMNGQRGISMAVAEKVLPKLGLKPSFLEQMSTTALQPLSDDEFSVLSDWSHFAILELIKTKDFRMDLKWMGRRLKLHPQVVQDSLARLERLGFVKITKRKILLLKPSNTWTNTNVTTLARQWLQKELLQKSKAAIDEVDFSRREHGSLTVAVDPSRMQEFKEKLKQVRRELDTFFQPANEKNNLKEVYQLCISFFPLSINEGVSHENNQ